MAPLIPRMHLFEIDDQSWFHPWFRARVQAALTIAWITCLPLVQSTSPARAVASLLAEHVLGTKDGRRQPWVMIDFCAGAGGPTPTIEQHVNGSDGAGKGRRAAGDDQEHEPVKFVLTDLHPHIDNWREAAARSPNVSYEPSSVDASHADPALLARHAGGGGDGGEKQKKKVFRLFNLAFHHFDDDLARAILKDTVETSDGFGIFELQSRDAAGFFSPAIFGLGILALAPFYAFKWRSPATLFWAWLVPVLPFVLVWDGWISSLRTRTPREVEVLLRTCGAEGGTDRWEVRSGSVEHLWPCGFVNWVICLKKDA
ncbi:uncharacterized protein E0L32_004447 [Thyridium curvatum]|uniref:Uncharacterized protein n=1 Tax=Thyridium curvatum TaxID=1093900 RepID=A0A507B6Q0_9PEZI|nr:uncharacterized protein E0L32_004447 [Thyridium curvatum]TPX15467.1 hypothetical protein E0L32_004447 [Thyridium curvatum]